MSARTPSISAKAALLLAVPLLGLGGCVTGKKDAGAQADAVPAAAAPNVVAGNQPGAAARPDGRHYVDPLVNAGANAAADAAPGMAQQGGVPAAPPANMGGLVMQPTGINAQAMSIFSSRQPVPQSNQISTTTVPTNAYAPPAGGIAPVRSSVFSQQPGTVAPTPLPPQQQSSVEMPAPARPAPLAFRNASEPYTGPTRNLFGGLTNLLEKASLPGMTRMSPNGIHVQNGNVQVSCFKPKLVNIIRTLESHFGKPVVVSSGYRDPEHNKLVGGAEESLHKSCDAADIQIDGVSKWDIASFVRALPERGGVGTYCHTQSIHVDIGGRRDWNWGCGRTPEAAQPI